MSISIKNLIAAVEVGNGPTMSSQFKVNFTLPSILAASDDSYTSTTLSILCQSANLPGTQLATTELPVYGPPIKMPYGLVYQDLSLTFLCTNNMSQRKIFEEWRRIIVDPTSNYVNYYDTYVGEVFVNKLNSDGLVIHTALFEEVYPVAILEQELNSANNDWLRLTVILAYRRWRTLLDLKAANQAGFGSVSIQPSPGVDDNPTDVFKQTRVPTVPKFNS